MTLFEKYKALQTIEFSKNPEETANHYAFRCVTLAYIIYFAIWVLNRIGLFIIDQDIMNQTMVECSILYVAGLIILHFLEASKPFTKYFLITWSVLIITSLTTHMTYHATIAGVIPIVFTSIYYSKKLRIYTMILMAISIVVSVFGGYYLGICDANMVLMTTTTLPNYISPENTFLLSEINSNPILNLSLFYVFPRIILYYALSVMTNNISNIVSMNTNYAIEMRHLAERDQMTGAYTKSKYLRMIENDYVKEERIGIIFWDINYLKVVNDTLGHEYGDQLIFTIAESIRSLNTDKDKTYRIGGDEFVMILRGGTEKIVLDKVAKWRANLKNFDAVGDIPLSASYGYAWGAGKDIMQIIRDADQMMYENKRRHHQLDGR